MRVAIVNDWIANMGGAERVLLAVHSIFPDAPIFCTIVNHANLSDEMRGLDIRPSFLQRMPLSRSKYQFYLPLVPIAVEQFDLSDFDMVISMNFSCAKGVITRPDTAHICFCHTPMRYAWDMFHDYRDREQMSGFTRLALAPIMNYLRVWDYASSARVDYFAANSTAVAKRIRKYYRRDCTVIAPPVDSSFFLPNGGNTGDYFLYVSRLVRYKRADLAVEAFNRLGVPLLVVGDGPERERLESKARANVKFLGRQSEEALRKLYRECRALIFPQEEDFGIVPLEAQACGRPVIAYGAGGVLDTVVDGSTGVFFSRQTTESLISAVGEFNERGFNSEAIRGHACSFDVTRFKRAFESYVIEKHKEHLADMMLAGHSVGRAGPGCLGSSSDGAVDRIAGTAS